MREAAQLHAKIKADFAARLADPGAYDLSVTPTGDSVDIAYRTAAFKSLAARNHALGLKAGAGHVLCGIISHGVLSLASMIWFGHLHHTTDCDAFVASSVLGPPS